MIGPRMTSSPHTVCRMGNREDLLAGAKECVVRLGYARTTARDIAEAAGTSLAAIAYHFDGKDNLMATAMVEVLDESIGHTVQHALAAAGPGECPQEQFLATWTALLDGLPKNRIAALAGVENFAQIDRVPAVHEALVQRLNRLSDQMTADFMDRNEHADPVEAAAVAKLYQVLMHGVTVCWLIDPSATPTPREMLTAMRALSGARQPVP